MDDAVLRQLVREVLRDLLPAQYGTVGAAPPARPLAVTSSNSGPAPLPPAALVPSAETGPPVGRPSSPMSQSNVELQPVRLVTDEDLHEFVLRLLRLADNPRRRRDLLAGRLRFTLASDGDAPAGPSLPVGLPVPSGLPGGNGQRAGHGATAGHRIEKGAVTERAVQAAAAAGARLVLGPRAVLTPLARDRARALGVPIEKER